MLETEIRLVTRKKQNGGTAPKLEKRVGLGPRTESDGSVLFVGSGKRIEEGEFSLSWAVVHAKQKTKL